MTDCWHRGFSQSSMSHFKGNGARFLLEFVGCRVYGTGEAKQGIGRKTREVYVSKLSSYLLSVLSGVIPGVGTQQ